MKSIYPTVTYPVHSTLITGKYPDKHGVINNEEFHPGNVFNNWNWYNKAIKGNDIFDAAKNAGKSTASVYWPVTGNHKSIDYLINEYCSLDKDADLYKMFTDSGSSEEIYQDIIKKNACGYKISTHPYGDDFCVRCACDIIEKYKPDFIAIHPANIDAQRHKTGVFSNSVTQAMDEVYYHVKSIITAVKNSGEYRNTNFIILSDHGQMNVTRVLNPNVLFKENGFIETNEDGSLKSYDAYSHSAAMSAQIYLKNPKDEILKNRVYKLLCQLRDTGIYGIGEVFTREEIENKEHLDGNFSFVIETDGYTTFGNEWNGSLINKLDNSDYKFGRATHGYLPEKGAQPVFIAFGPDIKEGLVIENGELINVAPTLSRLLNTSLDDDIDGYCMNEIFK